MKAIYGCIESALLWYDLYSKTMKSHGFVVNTYNKCIENSTITGKQCTIAWCVDYNKASHVDEELKLKLIETIAIHFGNLTLSKGRNTSSWGWT